MNCDYIQNHLIPYIDGNLSEPQKKVVEMHLEACRFCRKDLEELKQVLSGIEKIPEHKPDDKLKDNFYTMLKQEKKQIDNASWYKIDKYIFANNRRTIGFAAAIAAMFLLGYFIGRTMNIENVESERIALLKNEIRETKNLVMLSMLKQDSPSQRMKAVNYAQNIKEADQEVILALVNTLENDDNVNVRIEAARALQKYPENQLARDALLNALRNQKDPVMRINLIDMLVGMQEKRAVPEIYKLLQKNEMDPVVKNKMQEGLQVLL